jgi:two-component system sensor histidine kinase CiaH
MFLRARLRLTLVTAGATLAILLVLAAAVLVLGQQLLMAQATASLQQRAADVRGDLASGELQRVRNRYGGYDRGIFIVVWDQRGKVLFNPSNVDTTALIPAARGAIAGSEQVQSLEISPDQDVLVDSEPVQTGQAAAIQVGQSLEAIHALEAQAAILLVVAAAGALLLSLIGGWFLAGSALRPVAEALERQREFTANASHELRTPLTILDTGTQILARHPEQVITEQAEILSSMRSEAARMRRLIDELLELARADSGLLQLHSAREDLYQLAREAARTMEPLSEERRVAIRVSGQTSIAATVDGRRIQQLLVILLDNALRYAPAETEVSVVVARSGSHIRLEVRDQGPGIPAQLRAKVFHRFRSVDPSPANGGAGLGLAIAQTIVTVHRGHIALADNHPGLAVVVTLPA